MEGKKKSGKALLEEKQMKRYFRSIKRAKGKIKMDSPKKKSDFEVSEEKPKVERGISDMIKNQVTKATVCYVYRNTLIFSYYILYD